MAVKGLGFDMMSAYNRINVNDRTDNTLNVRESIKADEKKPVENGLPDDFSGVKINLNFDSIRRSSSARPDDLKDFLRRDTLNPVPDNISMKSEMDKAVSIMEKDSSIKQYQYFVGDTNIITNDEDGLVFIK